MKKTLASFVVLFLVTGCQTVDEGYSKQYVSWTQKKNDCVYEEKTTRLETIHYLTRDETKEYVKNVNTITYDDTMCSKIIEAELKNKTNKSALHNNFNQINSVSNTSISYRW